MYGSPPPPPGGDARNTTSKYALLCRSILWSLIHYCVRDRDYCCVLCDVTWNLLHVFTWYTSCCTSRFGGKQKPKVWEIKKPAWSLSIWSSIIQHEIPGGGSLDKISSSRFIRVDLCILTQVPEIRWYKLSMSKTTVPPCSKISAKIELAGK